MQLNKMRLVNYRCFKALEVDFSKITLILGPNSGGKTAIMSALLSAVQSDEFPLYFNPNGTLTETGDFGEVVYRHDRNENVGVELHYLEGEGDDARKMEVSGSFGYDIKTKMPSLVSATSSGGAMDMEVDRSRAKYKLKWHYKQHLDTKISLGKALPEFTKFIEKMHQSNLDARKSTGKTSRRKIPSGETGAIEAPLSGIYHHVNFESPWLTISAVEAFSTSVKFRNKFCYLGSHRVPPARTYFNAVGTNLKVGTSGQNCVEQVIDWSIGGSKKLSELVKVLKDVGLAARLSAAKLSGGRVELRVKTSSRSCGASIADVGFGVNQFLPIAVAELQLDRGSTVAISQPETHLHPSAQAAVGEHMARKSKSHHFRYIVETHSEYLVNRLRRLIAKGDMQSKDVVAYYVAPDKSGSSVATRMTFEPDGTIEGAPSEFFETYQIDVLGIAMRE